MIGFLIFMVISLTCVALITILALGNCINRVRALSALVIENRTDNMLNRAHIEMLKDTKISRADVTKVLKEASN